MVWGESWRGAGAGTSRWKTLKTLGISFSGAYFSKVVTKTDISQNDADRPQLSMHSLMDLKYPTPDSHVYSPCVLPEYYTQK